MQIIPKNKKVLFLSTFYSLSFVPSLRLLDYQFLIIKQKRNDVEMIYKREGINTKKPEKVIREKNLNAPIEKKPKQTKILSHPLYILVCQFN